MRRGKRGLGPPKRYGTPTVKPEPQGIDPWSGFKLPLNEFVKQWDGQIVHRHFVDKRNSQDYVRGIKDNQNLPFARPESPNQFVATFLAWEDDAIMTGQLGQVLLTEGIDPSDTL